ncbi:MAG TPA: DeoR family transcriptional regulator [Anaerolineales bacterium]
MPTNDRLEQIAALVEERGFLTVGELSELCQVSEMTIRRDLSRLDEQKRIQRTYGGAASLRARPASQEPEEYLPPNKLEGPLGNRMDVLVATALNPKYDGLLLESLGNQKNIPIIAESLSIQLQNEVTVVAVDNYQAGFELGQWAGRYAQGQWAGKAAILDLTYYLANTQARSRGFIDGVRVVSPEAEVVLSLDGQSRYDTAYQLTRDALTVHPELNIIFAINDIMASGAIKACQDLSIDPEKLMVLPYGLEGNTFKNALMAGGYCKAGLAMFPEIVGPACIEAAIAAYNHRPLPSQLITPHAVLTSETLPDLYRRTVAGSWQLRWEVVKTQYSIPINIYDFQRRVDEQLPRRIGFIVPFSEHEWYQNLTTCMQSYASQLKIEFENVDVHQSLKDEVDLRRREIARLAAQQVQSGEVVLIDGGPLANYLAEALCNHADLTVITNSFPVFDILRHNPEITLICTGGAYRHSSQMLVGPTAEGALRELRADKLFLMVTGVTLNFGLSHTNISEVTVKQAMIRSAREVILLADHTFFGQESMIQVAPLSMVQKLITDDALPASARLDLSKQGIQILLAKT